MTAAALRTAALVFAVATTLWAGLLAIAQQAPTVARTMGEPPGAHKAKVPVYRAIHMARLGLLTISAAASSGVVAWWGRPFPSGVLELSVVVALLYLVAESIPRGLAALMPRIARSAALRVHWILFPFAPLFGLITTVETWMHRLLPVRKPVDRFGPEYRDMLIGVFSLSDTTVEAEMTPRLDIVAVESTATWKEIVELIARSDHARIPVYQDDLDNIAGILYLKDLTPAITGAEEKPERWQDLIRPALFVPESKKLPAQLRDFQKGPSQIAIVVDEFGGTSGLITLEDVLEEIVGEIYGEYDLDEVPPIEREGEDRFWVEGSLALDDLSQLLGTEVECEDVTTVGGLVYSELGRVPYPGEELTIGGFRVVVEQVRRRRIKRVYFERIASESADDASDRWEE
jgi:CBS domain containing-hemolysin-like protein